MLSGLPKNKQNSFAQESKKDMDSQHLSHNDGWEENPNDVIMAGSNQVMSHQERYEFVKNRVYSPTKPVRL